MGKSPGKWIRGVLFRKKSSRAHASKGREVSEPVDHKDGARDKGHDSSSESPVISRPIPVNAPTINLEAENGAQSSVTTDGAVISQASQNSVDQAAAASAVSDPAEKIREEQAAVKAQAAFRGYLARRAFRALRGIIRLQALIRGHLVRRQAVATLHCMHGIVKLQSRIRGRRVRTSGIGSEVYSRLSSPKVLGSKLSSPSTEVILQKTQFSTNVFVRKLSKITVMPLQVQFASGEPNSVMSWLERWSLSRFWRPLPKPKKTVDLKSQARNGGYAVETESGRPKRSVRRNFSSSSESAQGNSTLKRNFKKINSAPVEVVQDHPQSELEKVKRNLRKISNPVPHSSDQADTEPEKPKPSAKRTSSVALDVPEHATVDSTEKAKKTNGVVVKDAKPETATYQKSALVATVDTEIAKEPALETEFQFEIAQKPAPEIKPDVEMPTKISEMEIPGVVPDENNLASDLHLPHEIIKENNDSAVNKKKMSNEAQGGNEIQKTTKRRASLSDKTDYVENGLQNSPAVPSYMAATESAKAKLRAQGSPRLSSDGIEKNGYTRRHSLPSPAGGKQRQVTGKGMKNEKSFSASRDGHDRPVQVEWRR